MKKLFFILFLMLFQTTITYASDWEFTLRDKAKEPPKRENGASVVYTNPESGDSSYKIDAALNFTSKTRTMQELFTQNLAIEFHRNNQTSKEVDSKILSYAYGHQWLSESEDGQVISYHKLPLELAYKIDDVAETESVLASIYYYPEFQLNKKDSFLNVGKDIFLGQWEENAPHPIRINWQPNCGLIFEDLVESDDGNNGNITRFNAGIQITVNLMKDRLVIDPDDKDKQLPVETLVLSLSYQYWYDLSKDESAFGTDDNHDIKSIKFSYPLDNSGNIRMFVSYLDGENPVKGKTKQIYSEIGIEFKLDF